MERTACFARPSPPAGALVLLWRRDGIHACAASPYTNADTRKTALAVQLAESPAYQWLLSEARAARERLADAERRAAILRERCRLHRAAVGLSLGTDGKGW